uniref:PDZ domain containing 11 n=1 Tax=Gopherus evgoodei TaxID=1825980 RepID=A0A8C4WDG1_9SAUR
MDSRIPYDDYPVVFLPAYENPPAWIPPHERICHPDYNNELTQYLPRTIVLKKPVGAQLGFNIRGGKASQLGIFISKVIPDSDAHRAGLQEGDQVLAVNDVDFQDIEHSKVRAPPAAPAQGSYTACIHLKYTERRGFKGSEENRSCPLTASLQPALTCSLGMLLDLYS